MSVPYRAAPRPLETSIDWSRFRTLVAAARRVVLTTHVRPDGDAVGSSLGMAAVLDRLGLEVRLVNAFSLPARLRFLDSRNRLEELTRSTAREAVAAADLIVVLDTSAWGQLGDMAAVIAASPAKKAVIDHHVSGDDLGAEVFKDSAIEATGRLVVEAADALGVALDAEIATPLFAALATDTGWFRFNSASAATYHLASRLIAAGAVPADIYQNLYENDSLARVRLAGRGMARAESELAGRLIYTWLTAADFDELGALPSDSEDLINRILAVGGAEVAIILIEQSQGGARVSFRSRSAFDCTQAAARFGGGGHVRAAGASVAGDFAAAKAAVLDVVRNAMQ